MVMTTYPTSKKYADGRTTTSVYKVVSQRFFIGEDAEVGNEADLDWGSLDNFEKNAIAAKVTDDAEA